MNRFDRITAILIQLQSRKIVRAQDLADRFEISLRTVYRDINSLAEAGVPIIGEAGIGYSIMDGYRLPPVMFTKEEARTFITAEKLVEKFTDLSTQTHYQSAMYKIKAVLRTNEKAMVETLENHIEIRRNNIAFNDENSNTLDTLLKSITERKALKIQYMAISADEPTERIIEPVGIYHENDYWYTVAYCHLRRSYRNFRSDRFEKIELLDRSFDRQHAPLSDFLNQVREQKNLQLVTIKLDKKVARYIREQRYYYGFVSETQVENALEMVFLTASLEGFARWYLMIAPNATIINPPQLKDTLRRLVAEISATL